MRSRLKTGSILVMGPPRCGKGTQCGLLAQALGGATCISSGQQLRDTVEEMSAEGRDIMEGGGLVPSNIFERAVKKLICDAPRGKALILDGMAKKGEGEAYWLFHLLNEQLRPLTRVINLVVDETIVRGRPFDRTRDGGRPDDDEAVQDERWACYNTETMASLEYFRRTGLVIDVDADGTIEEIWHRICYALELIPAPGIT